VTLQQATHWTAQLGNYLGRHGDGPPGAESLGHGLCRLYDMAFGWHCAQTLQRCV